MDGAMGSGGARLAWPLGARDLRHGMTEARAAERRGR